MIRTLSIMLQAVGINTQAARGSQIDTSLERPESEFMEQAVVIAEQQSGALVQLRGETISAGLSIDMPMFEGQLVWVMRTDAGGYNVVGIVQ